MDIYSYTAAKKSPQGQKIIAKTKETVGDLTIKFADLVVAAFGIVSALSFNDAVKSLFTEGGVFEQFAKGGPWVAAFVITLLAIAVGYWRSKILPTKSVPSSNVQMM